MNKRVNAVVLFVPLLLLSGCAAPSADDSYLLAVESATPEVLDRGSREDLIDLGHAICEGLAGGKSAYDLADDFTELGWSVAESGTVVVQAATYICPEYEDQVR